MVPGGLLVRLVGGPDHLTASGGEDKQGNKARDDVTHGRTPWRWTGGGCSFEAAADRGEAGRVE